jgi:outer membrane protein assembly factor BamE (lipoprotein component of BamABCDE complex)
MKFPFLLPLALLAACAAQSLRPGMSEAEVRAALGKPALELPEAGGGRTLVYPTGPLGMQTHMAHLGADGRLTAYDQVLRDERFHAIRQGMTSEELLRYIGPPFQKTRFANLKQTAWDYRFRDTWGYTAILSVMLDDNNVVAGRVTQRIDPRDAMR